MRAVSFKFKAPAAVWGKGTEWHKQTERSVNDLRVHFFAHCQMGYQLKIFRQKFKSRVAFLKTARVATMIVIILEKSFCRKQATENF